MTTPMNAEPLFVAMTRHREALTLHVDTELGQQGDRSATIALSRFGRLRGTDEANEGHHNAPGDGDHGLRERLRSWRSNAGP